MIGYPDLIIAEDTLQDPLNTRKASHSHCSPSSARCLKTSRADLVGGEMRSNSAKLVIVEGNIGVGKTTLTRKLANELHYKLFLEPTTENPYLEKFYADPHKYALKLQLWILRQRYLTYLEAVKHMLTTGGGAILDRSVYSDCVFARVCNKEGYISNEGFEVYQYWRSKALEDLPVPHVTIFLDATPLSCFDRIQQRARECESGVPLDYLEKLHEEYHKFINEMRSQGSCVLRFDWSAFSSEKKVFTAVSSAEVSQWCVSALLLEDAFPLELPLVDSTSS